MRNTAIIISILICLQLKAQVNDVHFKSYKLKGRLEKNVTFEKDCNSDLSNKNGIIIAITVTDSISIEKFGNTLYVATICPEIPGLGWFDGKEYEIEILDYQKWQWKIKILNPELFKRNKDKKKYWMENICCKSMPLNRCSTK